MARKTHKGQHFVPECYLKAWCDPACPTNYEPYVWLFDRDGSNAQNKAPFNIFKERTSTQLRRLMGRVISLLSTDLAGWRPVSPKLERTNSINNYQ